VTIVDQRAALERLIRERREDYAGLSRLIGRNAAYIQQFIKRGIPRKLDEADRRTLARYFQVDEQVLGGPPSTGETTDKLVRVARLDVGASAGPGALPGEEASVGYMAFEERWVRQVTSGKAADLSMIKVQGDSMEPTLSDGDDLLVDTSDSAARLRDGIYVLRREETVIVKRIALNPLARRMTIKSDNPAYPDWPDCDLETLDVVGRVVWAGRRIR
jgi:phage repressor protein C with HTH and peptisase S24 domain